MGSLGFLREKKFYIHLGLTVVVTFILLFLTLKFLDAFTRHGKAYILPDLLGATLDEIARDEISQTFDIIVTDSVYDNDQVPGTVVKQNPVAGSKVKHGRNVYVTTVATTPAMAELPGLKDLTLRQALSVLKTNGLGVNSLIYREYLADNAIIGQYFEGDTIYTGTMLRKGSKIDLVVGTGSAQNAAVPFLIGLSREEARELIMLSSFNPGSEFMPAETDMAHARVYQQSPAWSENYMLPKGTTIDVWLKTALSSDFQSLINNYRQPDTAMTDSIVVDSTENLF